MARKLKALGREYFADFENLMERRTKEGSERGAEAAYFIVNMMLPKGVKPPGKKVAPDHYDRLYKGEKPRIRMARLYRKIDRGLNTVTTRQFYGAGLSQKITPDLGPDYEKAADLIFNGEIEKAASLLATQDAWAGQILGYAATLEDNSDVIDHWEHLATLDDVTCDECAGLDGAILPAHGDDEPWDLTDIHPNCRCIPIPISKTWEKLGEELGIEEWKDIPEPEGSRIARTDEGGRASPTGFRDEKGNYHEWVPKIEDGHLVGDNWQPGWEPVGGNQFYVDASTRYMDWAAQNPKYAGDWFIPPDGGVPSVPSLEPRLGPEGDWIYPESHSDEQMSQAYKQWHDNLTQAQREALDGYSHKSYWDINEYRRTGIVPKELSGDITDIPRASKEIEQALRVAPLKEDVTVYRGMAFSDSSEDRAFLNRLLDSEGKAFRDKGFLSTSFDGGVAEGKAYGRLDWPNHDGIVFQISVPSGTPAGYLGKQFGLSGERELLLNSASFVIDSIVSRGGGAWFARAHLIP